MSGTEVEHLYQNHYAWLHAWLKKRLNNSHTAADLAQDTFVRILSKQDKLYFDRPQALLTTIARGVLVNWLQRQAIEQAYLEVLAAQPEQCLPSPEQQLQSIESLALIFKVLASLPERQQQIFIYSQLEGMKQQEIAQRLHISVRTVIRDLSQALTHCLSVIHQELP
ncbi:sigma-70 family RNA polymerase sigma factor [Acinetobacter larvae]|nr:sigma-70 family RNA polymerase sigma factor [Acinetobacter larvae]